MRSFQLSVRSKIESGRCSNGPLAGLLVHLLMNEGNDLPTSLARATLLRGLIRNPQGYTMYCSEAVLRRIYYPSQVESICKIHYVIDYPGLVVLCKKVFENQIHLERFQKNGISFDPINDLDLTNQFLMWNEKGVRGKPGMHQRLKVRWQIKSLERVSKVFCMSNKIWMPPHRPCLMLSFLWPLRRALIVRQCEQTIKRPSLVPRWGIYANSGKWRRDE